MSTSFERNLSTISLLFGAKRYQTYDWFLSFGSLLYLVRDYKNKIEFGQDIDISYIGNNYRAIRNDLIRDCITPIRKVIDERNSNILHEEWRMPDGMTLDVFVWINARGKYWHTYDYNMERPQHGILSQYHFKSLPLRMFPKNLIRYEFMYDEYTIIPDNVGTLLDYWYPLWPIPDPQFGVSKAEEILNLRSCNELCQ